MSVDRGAHPRVCEPPCKKSQRSCADPSARSPGDGACHTGGGDICRMAHKRWDFGRRTCGTGRKNYGILQHRGGQDQHDTAADLVGDVTGLVAPRGAHGEFSGEHAEPGDGGGEGRREQRHQEDQGDTAQGDLGVQAHVDRIPIGHDEERGEEQAARAGPQITQGVRAKASAPSGRTEGSHRQGGGERADGRLRPGAGEAPGRGWAHQDVSRRHAVRRGAYASPCGAVRHADRRRQRGRGGCCPAGSGVSSRGVRGRVPDKLAPHGRQKRCASVASSPHTWHRLMVCPAPFVARQESSAALCSLASVGAIIGALGRRVPGPIRGREPLWARGGGRCLCERRTRQRHAPAAGQGQGRRNTYRKCGRLHHTKRSTQVQDNSQKSRQRKDHRHSR